MGLSGLDWIFTEDSFLVHCFYTNKTNVKINTRIKKVRVDREMWFVCTKSWDWSGSKIFSKMHCGKQHCPSGYEQNLTVINDTALYYRNWECIPCANGKIKPKNGTEGCKKCNNRTIPNTDRTLCVLNPELYSIKGINNINDGKGRFVVSVSVIGSAYDAFVIFTFYRYRGTPIIKSASLIHTIMQLFNHLAISHLYCSWECQP